MFDKNTRNWHIPQAVALFIHWFQRLSHVWLLLVQVYLKSATQYSMPNVCCLVPGALHGRSSSRIPDAWWLMIVEEFNSLMTGAWCPTDLCRVYLSVNDQCVYQSITGAWITGDWLTGARWLVQTVLTSQCLGPGWPVPGALWLVCSPVNDWMPGCLVPG